jgi:hypothetical protein
MKRKTHELLLPEALGDEPRKKRLFRFPPSACEVCRKRPVSRIAGQFILPCATVAENFETAQESDQAY